MIDGFRIARRATVTIGAVMILVCSTEDLHAKSAASCDSCQNGAPVAAVATSVLASYFGKSICQVFEAPDTLLAEFTVWRIADPDAANLAGMHLYLTEVDASGAPDVNRIVCDGPTIVLDDTSSTSRPVTFTFDPPLKLPHIGTFGAAIKEEDPFCQAGVSLEADSTESYPCGDVWLIVPKPNCAGLGASAFYLSGYDLHFHVAFACQGHTAALRRSWGQVKAGYR